MTVRFRGGLWCILWITAAIIFLSFVPPGSAASARDRLPAPAGDTPHARANYVWPHESGPFYGRSAPPRDRAPGTLHTRVGSFDLLRGPLSFPQELTARDRFDELPAQYFVIVLDPRSGPAGPRLRERIALEGGAVMQALPVASWIARLTPQALAAVRGDGAVLAVERYHPAFKLDPMIGRLPLADAARANSPVYDLELSLFDGEDAGQLAVALSALGGSVISVFPDTVRVQIHRDRLAAVAALEPVQAVHEYLPRSPLAEETTTTVQTGRWNHGATPYHDAGVDGGGGGIAAAQVLMVLDTGIQLDGADLSDSRTTAGTPGLLHRKVRRYQAADLFGGSGDLLGCDLAIKGGATHGHLVAATALGNATRVDATYGEPWYAVDAQGSRWKLDGVAPGALLVAFDAARTPTVGGCPDPHLDTLEPGDLYSGGASGSLGDAYGSDGARVFNLSWGAPNNAYTADAQDVDDFLDDRRDSMVTVAAGNSGSIYYDYPPAEGSLSTPATTKNGLAIGASAAANDLGAGDQERGRLHGSSLGPTPGGRIAPQLMAPGGENEDGDMGLGSEFGCRSSDNDQSSPVECDVVTSSEGTSYASAAAAGAALLVRDYFAQGFYPDGTSGNPGNATDQVPEISGALLKAALVASAVFLDYGPAAYPYPASVTRLYRFNNEQGYGRIQLDRALPLQNWSAGATGLVVADGGIPGGVNHLTGLDGILDVTTDPAELDSATFEVCDGGQELRVALAWIEASGDLLINDLDLELESPSGVVYFGNYFTDDNDRDGVIGPGEDCPSVDGASGRLDASAWSLPACPNAVADVENPTEAIMLSPDHGDAVETGAWTVRVTHQPNAAGETAQRYAVVVAGGVCSDSTVRLDRTGYTCSGSTAVTVTEVDDPTDPATGLDAAEVATRTTLEVLAFDVCGDGSTPCDSGADCAGIGSETCHAELVVDSEAGESLGFQQPDPAALQFVSAGLLLTGGTAFDPGNGVLDVRDGTAIRVVYADETGGAPDPEKRRIGSAPVDCAPAIDFGDIVFDLYGQDADFRVLGGCERNALGQFDFGYPDRYLDAGELVSYAYAFATRETEALEEVQVHLRCVHPDGDSPAGCDPAGRDCPDPQRLNNDRCDGTGPGATYMTILDSPRRVGFLPATAAASGSFTIQMAESIPGTPEVELLLEVRSSSPGKGGAGVAVSRQRLDVDESSLFYSTDFPTGGTEIRDYDNNEIVENPSLDYRFETIAWSDLTAGGTKNTTLQSPWNFDAGDGGFAIGVGAAADESTIGDVIAQWGEDKNFNNLHDGFCNIDTTVACLTKTDCVLASAGTVCNTLEDRDPLNHMLDRAWSTRGGCGWVSRASGATTGGAWHTGRISSPPPAQDCSVFHVSPADYCQPYETVSGSSGSRLWFELLVTPEIQKVNGPDYRVEIMNWAWNQAVDLADSNAVWTWELDTDTSRLGPVDLFSDLTILGAGVGPYGPVTTGQTPGYLPPGYDYYTIFSPVEGSCRVNGNVCEDNSACTGTCDGVVGGYACEADIGCIPGETCDLCGSAVDRPGSLGNNRESANSCFFQGDAGIGPEAFATLLLPGPADDDVDNDSDGTIDEHVLANGPIRNMGVSAFKGPDMRRDLLEDLYGETGETFQAALGMVNLEKYDVSQPDPVPGYGVGVDDMVIQWREYSLVQDASSCAASGECAVIDLQASRLYEGNTLLNVTVLEKSPPPDNDCDLDDLPDGTVDCDSDGTRDLTVRAWSDAEPDGEIVHANLAAGSAVRYVADLPVSGLQDVDGVLWVRPAGDLPAAITVAYIDMDDGTGQVCDNGADAATPGLVQSETALVLTRGAIVVRGAVSGDNGDDDGWADTNETVEMRLLASNLSGADLTGVVAWVTTDDPRIDCVLQGAVQIGDIPDGQTRMSAAPVVFRVADVQRQGACSVGVNSCTTDADCTAGGGDACDADRTDFSATFTVDLASDQFEVAENPQTLALQLDLDAVGGSGPGEYHEGFESGGFGTFTTMNLDAGLYGPGQSDGYRCQYSDPDWQMGNSYGPMDCWLGASPDHAEQFWWSIADADAMVDPIGRSYEGSKSLYMGYWHPFLQLWTTPLAMLEAVASIDPINLGQGKVCTISRHVACVADADCPPGEACVGVAPELSFKHQVSLIDGRGLGLPPGESAAVASVGIQLAAMDAEGTPIGDWVKLEPYVNVYDAQLTDQYTNCLFDPIDDGNTEDDFYEPEDPQRRLGPSTGCFPEFSFTWLGSTEGPFDPVEIGHASHGPGLEGEQGGGTWVESRFDLGSYQGRRVRLRFLSTSLEAGSAWTVGDIFPDAAQRGWDDGWWIDDVRVSDTLAEHVVIATDTTPNTSLPGCGSACGSVTADLGADPPGTLSVPGSVVELNAIDSVADRCVDGALQYRFWIDGNGDGSGGDPADLLLRGWTDAVAIVQAPEETTTYVADVRCSSLFTCTGSIARTVTVRCPASGDLGGAFATVVAPDPERLAWGSVATYDHATGALSTLDAGYSAGETGQGQGPAVEFDISDDAPPPGEGYWYLFRQSGTLGSGAGTHCNEPGISWGAPARDAALP